MYETAGKAGCRRRQYRGFHLGDRAASVANQEYRNLKQRLLPDSLVVAWAQVPHCGIVHLPR